MQSMHEISELGRNNRETIGTDLRNGRETGRKNGDKLRNTEILRTDIANHGGRTEALRNTEKQVRNNRETVETYLRNG